LERVFPLNTRLTLLGGVFALLWCILTVRVAYIQLVRSSHYRGIAENQSVTRDVLPPLRGEVFDRQGVRLAVNVQNKKSTGRSGARLCPNGPLAGQVLGMVGRDGYGQSGLELHLDRDLRGTDGWRYTRRDAKRRYAPGASDQIQPAVNGYGVKLTLDARAQSIAELALERGVLRTGAKAGVAVIVDPRTGDIIALANYPFFDPNAPRVPGAENWRNNAVAMVYEPGSTFKIVTAAALLEEGRIRPNDTIDGEGGRWQIGSQWIRDTHPMRRVSFADAVAHSSNIVFAKVSTRIPPVAAYKYIRSFGFGMKTGVSLPAEESGVLKPVANWSGRTQQTIAFGHEVSVTPLQLTMAFAAVANGGVLMRPRLVQNWVDGNGQTVRAEPPRAVRRVMSSAAALTLRRMMVGVVDHGTAADIRHPYIEIAGKTGSAQKINPETGRYMEGSYNASFAGMAPAENPAFVCLVVVDDPKQFKYGGQAAAPIFREILDRMAERGIGGNWGAPPATVTADAGARKNLKSTQQVDPKNSQAKAREQQSEKAAGTDMRLASMRLPGRHSEWKAAADEPASRNSTAPVASALPRTRAARGEMPDLRNSALRDALSRLRALGVEVEYTGAGRVQEQFPEPGSPVRRGDRARLKLGWAG
jgi:cell division protein FtsI/penicillin-binding protein 2